VEERPLTVGFGLLTLVPGGLGGSESYVRGLLGAFSGPDRIVVLANRELPQSYAAPLGPAVSIHGLRYRYGFASAARAAAMLRAALAPRRLERSLPSGLDVLHYPLTVPIPRSPAPGVVTLHDLQHRELPEFFSAAERAYRARAYDRAARNAAHVISVSEHGRAAAIELLGLDPARVTAIPWGLDHDRFRPGPVEDDAELLAPYRLPERFLLYPANLWPHKNHEALLRALARCGRPDLTLVLTGQPFRRLGELERLAGELGVGERVRHLGYVPSAVVPALYRAATALAFPSLYEGFGGPPLEAMACGCPVASSRAASLEEVCGDAALYFDPSDVDELAAALHHVVGNTELRDELRRAGLERAAGFTWDKAASAHLDVYRAAAIAG
jgi:glycosyltransferase involved in cell wall biosynthesis